jgi:hypothetical protein
MKHNPIIKAMTPETRPALAPPKKKEKPAISFQREIEMITAPITQGPRRAMDYEPPASFLQNMDRPVREKTMGHTNNVLSDLWSV